MLGVGEWCWLVSAWCSGRRVSVWLVIGEFVVLGLVNGCWIGEEVLDW